MIRMNINPNPDLSMHWSDCPVKLPAKLAYHSNVLYNDRLIVTGGINGNASASVYCEDLIENATTKTASQHAII
jgi:hypothetical protein